MFQKTTDRTFKVSRITNPLQATYLSSHLVVMKVHERPGALFDLPSVHEHLGEAEAVADIGRAAAPLPSVRSAVEALLLLITAALAQVPLRARCRDGVSHARCDDGVRERGFLTA